MKSKSIRIISLFLFLSAFVFAADYMSKNAVSHNLALNETLEVFSGVFDITYIRNYGVAFNMLNGKKFLLIFITGILLLCITLYVILQRKKISLPEVSALALIAGGGAGNLFSRIQLGYVVDFLNFYFWPVFNVADIAVCIGCVLLLITVFIEKPDKVDRNG